MNGDKSPDAPNALEANVRTVFEHELVVGDIRKALGPLSDEGVRELKTEGGKVAARIVLAKPQTAADVQKALQQSAEGKTVEAKPDEPLKRAASRACSSRRGRRVPCPR